MPSFSKEIADTVTSVGVHAAYGEPLDIDGTTVVPVAAASYGFGAGEGGEGNAEGAGAGGGGFAWPVGAYVTRDGLTKFEPNTIALICVGIPFVWVAGRAIARVIRALKK